MSTARKGKEFGARVKAAALKRANGICEECKQPLKASSFHFDHVKAIALGGDASLDNCAVLCTPCHKAKTRSADMPVITKADNQRKAHQGLKAPKAKIPYRKAEKRPSKPLPERRSLYVAIATGRDET